MINTNSLTISGQGFDTDVSSSTLIFTTRSGVTFESTDILEATRTVLVVDTSSSLTSTYWGNLSVVVSIKDGDDYYYNSTSTVISDLRIVQPTIDVNTTCNVTTSDKNVTLYGDDFDFDVDQSNVTCYALCTDGETEKAVLGATSYVHSDVSYIVFDFYDLAPRHSGCDLYFSVQVASNPSAPDTSLACFDDSVDDCTKSSETQVCSVVSASPTISENTTRLSVNTKKLTIQGSGFDATVLTNNVLSFNSSSNDFEVRASVHSASSTSLVLTFDRLSLYNVGDLSSHAEVSDGSGNTVDSSSYVKVAEITSAVPIIDESCKQLNTNAKDITIFGSGFEAYNISNNNVTIYYISQDDNTDTATEGSLSRGSRSHLVFDFTSMMPSFSDCSKSAVSGDDSEGDCDGYSNSNCTRDNMSAIVSLIVPSNVDFSGDTTSDQYQVAKLISVDPLLTTSDEILSSDTATLTVYGSGWDTTSNGVNNLFSLWTQELSSTDCSYDSSASVSILAESTSVTSGENSNVIIEFTQLSNINEGLLCGYVSTTDVIEEGKGYQIAKVVSVDPNVTESSLFISSDATTMTIRGTGFDSYNETYQDTMTLSLTMENGRSFSTSMAEVNSSELTDYIAVTIPSREYMVITFCESSEPPSVASDSCALQVTDDGVNIQASVSFQLDSTSQIYSSDAVTVGTVGASMPCTMRERFGYHPCSSRGTAYNSIVNVDTNITLDVSDWACQCDCDQSDSSDFAYGEYCSLTLTDEQVKCHYRCINTEECNTVYDAWQKTLIYSSHPNYRTFDPVAFYEYQLEHAVSSSYSKLGTHLSIASFFLCMDHANGTSVSRVMLDGSDSTSVATIVSASTTSGAIRNFGDINISLVALSVYLLVALLVKYDSL